MAAINAPWKSALNKAKEETTMKRILAMLVLGMVAVVPALAERPFYRTFTLAGNFTTNVVARTELSITNSFTPNLTEDALVQQQPTFAELKFGYSVTVASTEVYRVSRGVTWTVTSTNLSGTQGRINLNGWTYSTGDVFRISVYPVPTNNTTVEINYQ
jgi:hypothetical protein